GSDDLPSLNFEFLMKFSMCARRLSRGAFAPMYVASSGLLELLLYHSTTLCARSESTCVPSSQRSSPKLNVSSATRSFSSATSLIQIVSPPFSSHTARRPVLRLYALFDTSCLRSLPLFEGSPGRTSVTGQTCFPLLPSFAIDHGRWTGTSRTRLPLVSSRAIWMNDRVEEESRTSGGVSKSRRFASSSTLASMLSRSLSASESPTLPLRSNRSPGNVNASVRSSR